MKQRTSLYLICLAAASCLQGHAAKNQQGVAESNVPATLLISNELKAKATEAIRQLRAEGYSCSQATFLGLCSTLGSELSERQLKAISAGLRGGIGKTFGDGTCGALTAAVMAVGHYLPDDNDKATTLAAELYKHFKEVYGTVKCGDIVEEYQFTRCTGCCLCMGEKVVELLQREKASLPQSTLVAWRSDVEGSK